MGIDVWEVIDAAKTKPFGFQAFYPGPGLGGHCIPIDPFYLTWKAAEYGVWTRFIELAGEINTSMPAWVVAKVRAALSDAGKGLKGAKVLVLGLAYKPDIDDERESPIVRADQAPAGGGRAGVLLRPALLHHETHPPARPRAAFRAPRLAEEFARYDLVLLATAHREVRGPCSLSRCEAGGGHAERGEGRVGPQGGQGVEIREQARAGRVGRSARGAGRIASHQ